MPSVVSIRPMQGKHDKTGKMHFTLKSRTTGWEPVLKGKQAVSGLFDSYLISATTADMSCHFSCYKAG